MHLGYYHSLRQFLFIHWDLANIENMTPQRLSELEGLILKLKSVWQIAEEPNFPWKGYIDNSYNLQVRLELTNILDNLISTIESIKMETSDLSSKLGIDKPTTIDRIRWLISITQLLSESLKPEKNWVIKQDINTLIQEAKNLKEICEWRKTSKAYLENVYNESIFNLPLYFSGKIEKALAETVSIIKLKRPEEGELFNKRRELGAFLTETADFAQTLSAFSNELADYFGFSTDALTIDLAKRLARIAIECFGLEKPEETWFNPLYLRSLKEMIPKAKTDFNEHNTFKKTLDAQYTDKITELDLDQLIVSFNGQYKSALRWLRTSYYRDKKQIELISKQGKLPDSVVSDLILARKLKTLDLKIDIYVDSIKQASAHYFKGFETDFETLSRGVDRTERILALSWVSPTPIKLTLIASSIVDPNPNIKQLGIAILGEIEKWNEHRKVLSSIVDDNFIPQTLSGLTQIPLINIRDWATKTKSDLTNLDQLTTEALSTCKAQCPKNYKELVNDLQLAEKIRDKAITFQADKTKYQSHFGQRFQEYETDWTEVITALEWTNTFKNTLSFQRVPEPIVDILVQGPAYAPDNANLQKYFVTLMTLKKNIESRFMDGFDYERSPVTRDSILALQEKATTLKERINDLQMWIDFKSIEILFEEKNLKNHLQKLLKNPPKASDLIRVFNKAFYQEWLNFVYNNDNNLGKFRKENHEELIKQFKALDSELVHLTSNRIMELVNSRKPQGTVLRARDSEIAVLLKEAAKKKKHMPIRNLFKRIPNLLQILKPCLLMSPLSVSQFLAAEAMKFDLVLFDEASQIVPEDAIGAIYRGKFIVVAGDNQQSPPTSFFQKALLDDEDWDEIDDNEIQSFESILDICSGIGLPEKTLRWHYRSKHEDLIAFSNHRFYSDKLITFPSAISKHDCLGVKLLHVKDGIYYRGGRRDNPKEAQEIAKIVFDHYTNYPSKTLGVVAFSMAQMDAINDAIELKRKETPQFEHFFKDDRLEGFFVKNLENVQGDERDVIIFSVGYGPDERGQITMNFGPLNKQGGERRLNVAITRAREKIILVSSILASDFDLKSVNASGVLTLYQYLDYAERGTSALKLDRINEGDYESPLEEEVATEIRQMGYNTIPQVGCSGYRIDLGVLDPANPGRFILGVECDGATYHCSSSARDRDRLREQVLKQLGWKIYRIWSPTWVSRREDEVKKLREAIQIARSQFQTGETTSPTDTIKINSSSDVTLKKEHGSH